MSRLPIESPTPLLLVSEIAARLNFKNIADTDGRILGIILQASQAFQAACGRCFDEFIDTRYYTPTHLSVNGDLFGLRDLRLDMDLKSLPANTTVINGDASQIATGNMKFEPLNSPYKQVIRLNPYGIQFWYHAGVTDPHGSISVTGTWGYGGGWTPTGASLSVAALAGDTTISTGTILLENGMVLLIDSEYLYVSSVTAGSPNTAVVIRAFNGSTAAGHLISTPISRWKALAAVQRLITRLVQWVLEQDKSPLFGQTIIGDVVFPTTVDSYPKDIVSEVRTGKLKRLPRIQAV